MNSKLRFAALLSAGGGFLDSYAWVAHGHVFTNAEPVDGRTPTSLQRLPKATDVYCEPRTPFCLSSGDSRSVDFLSRTTNSNARSWLSALADAQRAYGREPG